MKTSKNSQNDLTSTIHLSHLRPVPATHALEVALEKLSQDEQRIIGGLSPEKAMLLGVSGPAKGFRFLLDSAEITIGRQVTSDISLDDVTVSRKHAQISREVTPKGAVHILEDSKSLNGTYVNAVSITSVPLKDGDEIQLGKFRFVFFSGKVNS